MQRIAGLCETRATSATAEGKSDVSKDALVTQVQRARRCPLLPLLALVALFAVACGSPRSSSDVERSLPKTTVTESSSAVPRPAVLPPRDSVSAHAVTWDLDLALGALRSAGLGPAVRGSVREPFFSQAGTLVRISGAELELFIYGDAVAAGRDIDGLDTLTVSPRGHKVVWRKPAALVTSNNLVTIVLTADPAVREEVRRVLGSQHDAPHASAAP